MKKLTAEQASEKLIEFVNKHSLSQEFNGKRHILASAWTYGGSLLGLTAIPHKPEKIASEETLTILYRKGKPFCVTTLPEQIEIAKAAGFEHEKRTKLITYECSCDIMSGNKIVTKGFGLCSNAELFLCGFDEYSLLSMSQTRSIAKGFRNVLGYLALSAGFSDTAAEEMKVEETVDTGFDVFLERIKTATKEETIAEIEKHPEYADKLEVIQLIQKK